RRFNKAGIHCYHPVQKIPLTLGHWEQRVAFALENLVRT
ncbi:hypothetical protein EAI_07133, partial [Harpegnathos saltator]